MAIGRVNVGGGGVKFKKIVELVATAKETLTKNDLVYIKRRYTGINGGIATFDVSCATASPISGEFNPIYKYLSVRTYNSPYVYNYKYNELAFTKLANPSVLPSSNTINNGSLKYSADGKYQVIIMSASPYIMVYSVDPLTDTFTKLPNLNILPSAEPIAIGISKDGTYLAYIVSKTIFLYKLNGTQYNQIATYTTTMTPYTIDFIPNRNQMIFTAWTNGGTLAYTDSAITLLCSTLAAIGAGSKNYVSSNGDFVLHTPDTVTIRTPMPSRRVQKIEVDDIADNGDYVIENSTTTFDISPTDYGVTSICGALSGKIVAFANTGIGLFVYYLDGNVYKRLIDISIPARKCVDISKDGKYLFASDGNTVWTYKLAFSDYAYKAGDLFSVNKRGAIAVGYVKADCAKDVTATIENIII